MMTVRPARTMIARRMVAPTARIIPNGRSRVQRPARRIRRARPTRRIAIRTPLHNPRADSTRPAPNTSARIIPTALPAPRRVIIPAGRIIPARPNIPAYAIAKAPTVRDLVASAVLGGGRKDTALRKRRPYEQTIRCFVGLALARCLLA
jgi:hypothetical protein